MERLTRDLLENNTQTLLNYAFSDHLYTGDEKGRVLLAYAGDSEDMDLCEYVSKLAREKGCNMTPMNVMDGGCMECDCPVGILYVLGVQAAELHARLYAIEKILGDTYDLNKLKELWAAERSGALLYSPCNVGDSAFWLHNGVITDCIVTRIQRNRTGLFLALKSRKGSHGLFRADLCMEKNVFLTREGAEAAAAGRVVPASDLYDEDGGEIAAETDHAADSPTWKGRLKQTFMKGAEE